MSLGGLGLGPGVGAGVGFERGISRPRVFVSFSGEKEIQSNYFRQVIEINKVLNFNFKINLNLNLKINFNFNFKIKIKIKINLKKESHQAFSLK